ncbi:MAG: stage II sporulation protein M [Dehalococcoidales bacterium]|nr:MAG: stage II sporulation protein M [Dehalococcoidales bacterium]
MKLRIWLFISAGLFIFGLLLGLLIPTEGAGLFLEEAAALDEMAGIITPLPQVAVFIFILLKNISVIVLSFVMSPLLCIVPVITLVINGGVIGLVSAIIIEEESLSFLLAGLLPHGILELPALIIGEAVALSFGIVVLQGIFGKDKQDIIKSNLKTNLKYLAISACLFFAAAVIETFVTPVLLDRVA